MYHFFYFHDTKKATSQGELSSYLGSETDPEVGENWCGPPESKNNFKKNNNKNQLKNRTTIVIIDNGTG